MTTSYIIFFASLAALTASVIFYQRWYWRTGQVPDLIAQAERTNLLEAIEEAATEPQMRISVVRLLARTRLEQAAAIEPPPSVDRAADPSHSVFVRTAAAVLRASVV